MIRVEAPVGNNTVDPNNKPPEANSEEPKLLAGRFKSQEELEKGYLELLKVSSQPKPKEEPKDLKLTIPEPKAGDNKPTLDFNKFNTEIANDGNLSEDSLKSLEAAGIPKAYVESYIAGQQAIQEKQTMAIQSIVGGPQVFDSMIEWAGKSLSAEEIKAFNSLVLSPDNKVVELAVRDLHSKYKAKTSEPPKRNPEGKATASGSTEGVYESHEQFMADIRKPEYSKDPAYRKKVQEKLSRSKF